MPIIPKPIKKPEWATTIGVYGGKTNAYEPAAGLKPEGDQYALPPVRNVSNWNWHWVGQWIDYLEAVDGAVDKAATITFAATDSSDEWKQGSDVVLQPADNQAAVITAALAALPAGGRAMFADGTYTLTQAITVPAVGMVLQGQGPMTRFKVAALVAHECFAFSLTNGYWCAFRDFIVESDLGVAGALYSNGMFFDTCEFVLVERVYCQTLHGGPSTHGPDQPKGVAIYAVDSKLIVSKCKLRPTTIGGLSLSGEAVWTDNCTVVLCDLDCVDPLYGGTAVSNAAFYLDGGMAQVRGCNVEHYSRFVFGNALSSSVIERNRATAITGDGVVLYSCTDAWIEKNALDTIGDYGVRCDLNCARIWVDRNRLDGITNTGISMAGTGCRASGNKLTALGGDGITLAGLSGRADDNEVYDCRNGIVVTADSAIVKGNAVDTCTANGIDLSAASDNGLIVDNRVIAAVIGIRDAGKRNKISNNQTIGCTSKNIHHVSTAENGSIDDNHCSEGALEGIEIEGIRVTCEGNTLLGATNNLIVLRVTATGCSVIGNVGPRQPSAIYGINHDGAGARGNFICQNRMSNVGTTADLRVQGALTNADSAPQTIGGVPEARDCRDNNWIVTSTVV